MFDDLFVSSQNKKHLTNLLSLAKVDGFFHLHEYELLLAIARKFGVSSGYLQKLQKNADPLSLSLPKKPLDRFHYWYDLLTMVLADGVVHEKEVAFVEKLTQIFQYSPQIIQPTLQMIQEGKTFEEAFQILKESHFAD
ncbi:tellurite resistance TerB family protein [Raineya orbicola]|jgi:DnaJ-domain-containing protein 1|uniref:Tellurite resistance protein TerB n=1 Tax=Raineya orbicola TaxID=2016530 RepID=A0A2N3IC24_9BACT|nr:TerB family tellurite resistance protein [Raineya orbicola]PKQ67840.1 hypothetical protein Rain11_1858 [Raineya orbicola]